MSYNTPSLTTVICFEQETNKVIKNFYKDFNYILDPHTAVGYGVLDKISCEGINIILSTAHPCKFPEAIIKAIDLKPDLPPDLQHIMRNKENYETLPNNIDLIKKYILNKI